MQRYLLFVILFFVCFQAMAKRTAGTWQEYLSYNGAFKIAVSSDKIFCATEGGLFYYDLEDNTINRFGDDIELSDNSISTIAYSDENDVLVIAYSNSNIDLLYDNGDLINLTDIKRKSMDGDKSINNIAFSDNEALLACGFGIVVLNLKKHEIKDTYYIGDGGTTMNINDVETDDDNIYAATDEGIYQADQSDDLANYANWSHVDNISYADNAFSHLVNHAGNIIANYSAGEWSSDKLFILDNGTWKSYNTSISYAYDMQSNGTYLTIAGRNIFYVIDENNTIIGKINSYSFSGNETSEIDPLSLAVDDNGTIWVADDDYDLVKINDDTYEKMTPPGPLSNDMFYLGTNGNDLWIAPGNYTGWKDPEFQRYNEAEGWTYFTNDNYEELDKDEFYNIVSIEVDPSNSKHVYVSSWGGGLLEFLNDEFVQRYYNQNSVLESALPSQPNEPYTWVADMAYDSKGNLWVTNAQCEHNLHKLSSDGTWESFILEDIKNEYNPIGIIVTERDDKWILVSGNGVYVVNDDGDEMKQLAVKTYFNNGDVEIITKMNDVYSIAEDDDGEIWIGTTNGVAVYSSPRRVWTAETFYGTRPSVDMDDGLYHPLLSGKTVTSIAVDGANRKWLGTTGYGVYLVSESGDEQILHFTSDDSPLLSDNILSISINDKTGEVFFGTDEGLVSYQGDATGGEQTYDSAYVYPNPVRETYTGDITVTGLIPNSDVKITDITGNLVYKTTSLGGDITWDGKNLNGHRVKTGVYLIFCNDEDGEETKILKLLFIH